MKILRYEDAKITITKCRIVFSEKKILKHFRYVFSMRFITYLKKNINENQELKITFKSMN